MKKLISSVVCLSMMIFASSAYAAEPVKILMKNQIDGAPIAISSDVSPDIKNNRTMVPLRVISENLGATDQLVGFESRAHKSDVEVILQLNSSTSSEKR